MTTLRQQAFEILENVPEENLLKIICYIQLKNLATISKVTSREKNLTLKKNADEFQSAIDGIKGVLSSMSDFNKNKSIADWREERLKEKYAEYFN